MTPIQSFLLILTSILVWYLVRLIPNPGASLSSVCQQNIFSPAPVHGSPNSLLNLRNTKMALFASFTDTELHFRHERLGPGGEMFAYVVPSTRHEMAPALIISSGLQASETQPNVQLCLQILKWEVFMLFHQLQQ